MHNPKVADLVANCSVHMASQFVGLCICIFLYFFGLVCSLREYESTYLRVL